MNKLGIVLSLILVLVGFGLGIQEITSVPIEVTETETRVSQSATGTIAEVVFVIDGDTIEIASGERVRLLGVDTPEIGECYYQEATDFVREQLVGRSVRLEPDQTDQDKYGRFLRHAFVFNELSGEEVHVNLRLIMGGYAEVLAIPPDRAYQTEFKLAELEAEKLALGRWGECK